VYDGRVDPQRQLGRLSGAIRDKVIEHYSTVDADQAGELYRPLFREYRSWFRQVPDLGYTLPVFTLNYDIAVELAAHKLSDTDDASNFPEDSPPATCSSCMESCSGRPAGALPDPTWSRRCSELRPAHRPRSRPAGHPGGHIHAPSAHPPSTIPVPTWSRRARPLGTRRPTHRSRSSPRSSRTGADARPPVLSEVAKGPPWRRASLFVPFRAACG
jgi:hypothetical protein